MAHFALVSGMARSGTTLAAMLLDRLQGVRCFSQPFPLLYVEAKRRFLREAGLDDETYPLGDYFEETRFWHLDVTQFLRKTRDWRPTLRTAFEAMQTYSGRYNRSLSLEQALDIPQPTDYPELFRAMLQASHKAPVEVLATKEVHVEEFYPALLQAGVFCFNVIRDPRDVIASQIAGRGTDFVGKRRPVLSLCRQWRKSVAFTILCENAPGFAWVSYESLVRQSQSALDVVRHAWNLPLSPAAVPGENEEWKSNSSFADFEGISEASVGRYREHLPPTVVQFVETVCGPEMHWLGLEVPDHDRSAEEIIETYRDPYPVEHPAFAADFSSQPGELEKENRRLQLLASGKYELDTSRFFLDPTVFQRLADVNK